MVEQIKDPVSDECHIIASHSAFIYFIIVFLVFSWQKRVGIRKI